MCTTRRAAGLVFLSALMTQAGAAQDRGTAELAITAVLIDGDLNPRPVPKHPLQATCGVAAPVRIVTGFDGRAQISLPAGACILESERASEFQGRSYRWRVSVTLSEGSNTPVELSNDNAVIEALSSTPVASAPDLPRLFREWQSSVVTVWSESGHGSGFLIDRAGLFLTNDHVVHDSGYVAVQFDERHKVRAEILATDPERDVAVIRVNPVALQAGKPVDLATASELARSREGEAVFTIGSPLNQKKVMTTGIVSRVEKRAIISDVNINHGNSGGPLFDGQGKVLGITTFGDFTTRGGPGISGVVRIDLAADVVAAARAIAASSRQPNADLLPVEPVDPYPSGAMRLALAGRAFKTFDDDLYAFDAGDFLIQLQTPVLTAGVSARYAAELHRAQAKREKKAGRTSKQNPALAEMRDWMEYVGENTPVLAVRVVPKLREGFWSGMARGLAASQGYDGGPARLSFATDFVSMTLFCANEPVIPIHPHRVEVARDVQNRDVSVRDATYYGLYTYTHDAIGPQCEKVSLAIRSLKKGGKPDVREVPSKIVRRIWDDFGPYRASLPQGEERPRLAPDALPSLPSAGSDAPVVEAVPEPRAQGSAGAPPATSTPVLPADSAPPVLESESAELQLLVRPWAEVIVDGESLGTTPIKPLRLPAGVHDVLLKHPGFEPVTRRVLIQPGMPMRLEIDLEIDSRRRASPSPGSDRS